MEYSVNEIKNKFLIFFKSYCNGKSDDPQEEYIQKIKKFGLYHFFPDNQYSRELEFCKQKYKIYFNELIKIYEIAIKEGLKPITLKGIPLSIEIYPKPEIRPFHDIDILIGKSDYEPFLKILNQLGFTQKFLFHDNQYHRNYEKEIVNENGSKFNIELELHYELSKKEYNIDTESYIHHSKKYYVFNVPVYILEFYDNLVYLIIHYINHYIGSCKTLTKLNSVFTFLNLNILADLALLIHKNKTKIEWDKIICKFKKQKILYIWYYFSQIFNTIFPGYIPKNYLSLINENKMALNKTYSILNLMPILCLKYFRDKCNIMPILTENVENYIKNNQILNCNFLDKKQNNTKLDQKKYDINLKYKPEDLSNIQKNTVIEDRPKTVRNLSFWANIKWDYKHLHLWFKIETDNLVLHNEKNMQKYWMNDCFELNFFRKGALDLPPIVRIYLLPINSNHIIKLKIFRSIAASYNKFLSEEKYISTIEKISKGYQFYTYIPWSFISIEPKIETQIPFDLVIFDYENESRNSRIKFSLSKCAPNQSKNVYLYSILKLCKLM